MSELSGIFGYTHKYKIGNREYDYRLMDHDILLEFEAKLYQTKLDNISKLKSIVDEKHYRSLLSKALREYEDSEFTMTGKHGKKILDFAKDKNASSKFKTMLFLVMLFINVNASEAYNLLRDYQPEVDNLLNLINTESVDKKEGTGDPKVIAPQKGR